LYQNEELTKVLEERQKKDDNKDYYTLLITFLKACGDKPIELKNIGFNQDAYMELVFLRIREQVEDYNNLPRYRARLHFDTKNGRDVVKEEDKTNSIFCLKHSKDAEEFRKANPKEQFCTYFVHLELMFEKCEEIQIHLFFESKEQIEKSIKEFQTQDKYQLEFEQTVIKYTYHTNYNKLKNKDPIDFVYVVCDLVFLEDILKDSNDIDYIYVKVADKNEMELNIKKYGNYLDTNQEKNKNKKKKIKLIEYRINKILIAKYFAYDVKKKYLKIMINFLQQ